MLQSISTLLFIGTTFLQLLRMNKVVAASQRDHMMIDYSHVNISAIRKIISDVNQGAAKTHHQNMEPKEKRCYVCVTYAQTIDGCIGISTENDPETGSSSNLSLSSPESFLLTHALRANFDAVLVGGNTLTADNPRLNNRLWKNHDNKLDSNESKLKQPIPVILDSNLRHIISMVESKQIIKCAMSHEFIIICCHESAYHQWHNKIKEYCSLHNVSIKFQVCDSCEGKKRLELKQLLQSLGENHGIESVMVEGGASVISSFLSQHADLVDCVCVTICPRFVGRKGLNALQSASIHECAGNVMLEFESSKWFQLGQDSIFLAS
jgi:riboflavin-specific deaminase-like protein